MLQSLVLGRRFNGAKVVSRARYLLLSASDDSGLAARMGSPTRKAAGSKARLRGIQLGEPMDTTITAYAELDDSLLQLLEDLDRPTFPEPLTRAEFAAELRGKRNLQVLVASRAGTPCGYKIGFEHSSSVFFSWSGGVLPNYRRQGVASRLMLEQHRLARNLGYSFVRTHTKNKYRDMLLLNIKSGFDVTGVYKNLSEKMHGIILEKSLE
jgi:GNAT superfamily N-acetyltransferase